MAKTTSVLRETRRPLRRTGHTDPDTERDPPKHATPVTFPIRPCPSTRPWNDASPPPNLRNLYSRIMKLSDISDLHLEALNIQCLPQCSPESLLPQAPDGTSHFPSLSSETTTTSPNGGGSYADAARSDAVSAKRRAAFEQRLAELKIDNDTAFRIITRTTKSGVKPPKLAYLRKFWEGLETMSEYWDASLDQYYEKTPSSTTEGSDAKRQRLDSVHGGLASPQVDGDEKAKPEVPHTAANGNETPPPTQPTTDLSLRYKGRRVSTGRDMPDAFRSDTLKAFLEAVTWPFNCNVTAPRHLPILQMNSLNLPVRQSAAVYRVPNERGKARAGWIEGPILGLQARPETEFEGDQRDSKARLDALREVGGLLQLAQERRRQGKLESKPGEGMWWTEKPRWGGGPGGEVEKNGPNADCKDVLMGDDASSNGTPAATTTPSRLPSSRRRKTPAMLWAELKCGSKLWDPKTDYEAIGKDPNSDWDEIFQVSSLNHHICIIKLSVHTSYTDYLTTGQLPPCSPSEAIPSNGDRDWHTPVLQRTKWFDLFDVDDRVEAFRALWGVMAWLMRDSKDPGATVTTSS